MPFVDKDDQYTLLSQRALLHRMKELLDNITSGSYEKLSRYPLDIATESLNNEVYKWTSCMERMKNKIEDLEYDFVHLLDKDFIFKNIYTKEI